MTRLLPFFIAGRAILHMMSSLENSGQFGLPGTPANHLPAKPLWCGRSEHWTQMWGNPVQILLCHESGLFALAQWPPLRQVFGKIKCRREERCRLPRALSWNDGGKMHQNTNDLLLQKPPQRYSSILMLTHVAFFTDLYPLHNMPVLIFSVLILRILSVKRLTLHRRMNFCRGDWLVMQALREA